MRRTAIVIVVSVLLSSCSIQKLAVNSLSDVLASGNGVFETDNDPELIGDALPFSLKLIESLLEQQPEHQGLLLAAASGYVFYSYAYIGQRAQEISERNIDEARFLRSRARNLFLRAHEYAIRAIEIDYPGMAESLHSDPEAAVQRVLGSSSRDLELLYWNAAALGLAISNSRNEPAMIARLPEVEAMLQHALQLDEAWNSGALHEFAISMASVSQAAEDQMLMHYRRAEELSMGRRASLYVTYAEADAVSAQDRAEFLELIDRALAVDIDAEPNLRLLNVIAQRRAQWLLSNVDLLFLE